MIELHLTSVSSERPRRAAVSAAPAGYAAALAALAGCVAVLPQPAPSADLTTIRLPPGFAIELFAKDLGFARFLTLDPRGTLLVSVPRAGRVLALPDDDRDGRADAVVPVVEGLDLPHGLAFLDGQLYVAETGASCASTTIRPRAASGASPTVVVPDLPPRGGHWTRTHRVGPDRRLYVSAGRPATTARSGTAAARRSIATGSTAAGARRSPRDCATRSGWPSVRARASSGRPSTAGTGSGRTAPPSTSPGSRRAGSTAGRTATGPPAGLVQDPDLGGGDRCTAVRRPSVLYQAHTAPLGLAFYTGAQFPPEYRGDLLVALHGSWNRSVPVGYKVIRVRLGGATPLAEDFATGWLAGGRSGAGRSTSPSAPTARSSCPTTAWARSTGSPTGAADHA